MPTTLNSARSQLLIIDVQERLLPAMDDAEGVVKGCSVLLEAASILNIPVSISEQYPGGLGATVEMLLAKKGKAEIFEKIHFSCLKDEGIQNRLNQLKSEGRDQLVLGGIESHICVLQTALDCLSAGFDTYIVSDAAGSRKQKSQILAEARMQKSGATIITTEMALFEWLGKAGSEEFKALSRLIK